MARQFWEVPELTSAEYEENPYYNDKPFTRPNDFINRHNNSISTTYFTSNNNDTFTASSSFTPWYLKASGNAPKSPDTQKVKKNTKPSPRRSSDVHKNENVNSLLNLPNWPLTGTQANLRMLDADPADNFLSRSELTTQHLLPTRKKAKELSDLLKLDADSMDDFESSNDLTTQSLSIKKKAKEGPSDYSNPMTKNLTINSVAKLGSKLTQSQMAANVSSANNSKSSNNKKNISSVSTGRLSLRAQMAKQKHEYIPDLQDFRRSRDKGVGCDSSCGERDSARGEYNFYSNAENDGRYEYRIEQLHGDELGEEYVHDYVVHPWQSTWAGAGLDDHITDVLGLDDDVVGAGAVAVAGQSSSTRTTTTATRWGSSAPATKKRSVREEKTNSSIDLAALLSMPDVPANVSRKGSKTASGGGVSGDTFVGGKSILKDNTENDAGLDGVSIDKLLKSVLLLQLADLSEDNVDDDNMENLKHDGELNDVLPTVPNRFVHEEQYIETFRPLLLEEVKAAIANSVCSSNNAHNGRNDRRRTSANDSNTNGYRLSHIRCASLHDRVGEDSLQEARVACVRSDGGGGGSSSWKPTGPQQAQQGDLFKDDLVVLLRAADLPDLKIGNLSEVFKVQHVLAIVLTAAKDVKDNGLTNQPVHCKQQSLLVIKGSTPPYQDTWACIAVLSLSTFLREWLALHSMRSHALMPLAPYILKASPVVSSSRLRAINNLIMEKLNIITTNRGSDERQGKKEIEGALTVLCDSISELQGYPVDGSVLKKSGVGRTISSICKDANAPEQLKTLANELVAQWKKQVKFDNKWSTLRKLRGGHLVAMPDGLLPRPDAIPVKMWETLRTKYNTCQLFAIQYVVQPPHAALDTQIALIQGPPGTGKTSTVRELISSDFRCTSMMIPPSPLTRILLFAYIVDQILGMIAVLIELQKKNNNSTNLAVQSKSATKPKEAGENGEKHAASNHGGEPSMSGRVPKDVLLVTDDKKKGSCGRLLVCAPSNAAVDEILSRLLSGVIGANGANVPVRMIRLGKTLEGVDPEVEKLTLEKQTDAIVQRDSAWLNLRETLSDISNTQAKLRDITAGTSRTTDDGKALRRSLDDLRRKKLWGELCVDRLRSDVRRQLLVEAELVACTLSSSGQQQFLDYILEHDVRFDTAIIDEAAQTTEPSTLIPIRYGCRKLILVGDPRQLPATVLSTRAEVSLGVSLFERLERSGHEVVMLTEQHRMHPEIRSFPSEHFYQGKLVDANAISMEVEQLREIELTESMACKSLVSLQYSKMKNLGAVQFLNMMHSREERHGKSYRNDSEVRYVMSMLQSIAGGLQGLSLAIITPYKAQVWAFRDALKSLPRTLSSQIDVNSVDGFQGREKDIVFFSCVRSGHNIGFVADERRMNVAITRARRCLVIVGNAYSLRNDPNWASLLLSLRNRKFVRTVVDTKQGFTSLIDLPIDDLPGLSSYIQSNSATEDSGIASGSTKNNFVKSHHDSLSNKRCQDNRELNSIPMPMPFTKKPKLEAQHDSRRGSSTPSGTETIANSSEVSAISKINNIWEAKSSVSTCSTLTGGQIRLPKGSFDEHVQNAKSITNSIATTPFSQASSKTHTSSLSSSLASSSLELSTSLKSSKCDVDQKQMNVPTALDKVLNIMGIASENHQPIPNLEVPSVLPISSQYQRIRKKSNV